MARLCVGLLRQHTDPSLLVLSGCATPAWLPPACVLLCWCVQECLPQGVSVKAVLEATVTIDTGQPLLSQPRTRRACWALLRWCPRKQHVVVGRL